MARHRGRSGAGRCGGMPAARVRGLNQAAARIRLRAQRGHQPRSPGAQPATSRWNGPLQQYFPVVPGSHLTPAGWNEGPACPARPAEEEQTHADSSHRRPPPPPHRGASAGGRNNTRGEDQNKLRQPGLRGLGSAALHIVARSAILVRPAYLPALDSPPVTGSPYSSAKPAANASFIGHTPSTTPRRVPSPRIQASA
jgi:hypothetical protein